LMMKKVILARIGLVLLLMTVLYFALAAVRAEPTGTLSYPVYVSYTPRMFARGVWSNYAVKSSYSYYLESTTLFSQSFVNASLGGNWRVSTQINIISTDPGHMRSAEATVWFNITNPVYLLKAQVYVQRDLSSFTVQAVFYVNNQQVQSYTPPSTGSTTATVALSPNGGQVQVKLYIYFNNYVTSKGAANATVDFVVVTDQLTSASTTVPVTYTAYPDRTNYTTSLSYSGNYIANATVKIPSDFTITSSSPSYTGRNSTHVWWVNANTQTITLQATSTTKLATSFTWYPVYKGSGCDAIYFDGASGYVSVTPPSISGDSPFTFEFMVAWLSQPKKMWIMDFGPWSTLQGLIYQINPDGTTEFGFYGSTKNRFSVLSYMGVWAHYAKTYNPAGANKPLTSYVNGVKITYNYLGTQTPNLQPTRFRIGYAPSAESYFRGFIAFIRVYNRTLSPDEITWNYQHPENPVRNGLVLWLAPRSYDPTTGKWYDLSGNGNDGTAYGGVTCAKFLPNATYIAYQFNVVLNPLPARFFVKNSSGYFELGVSGDRGLLSKASPGAYQLAVVYTNGTHASMLLSPQTVYVSSLQLNWSGNDETQQLTLSWSYNYGSGTYKPNLILFNNSHYNMQVLGNVNYLAQQSPGTLVLNPAPTSQYVYVIDQYWLDSPRVLQWLPYTQAVYSSNATIAWTSFMVYPYGSKVQYTAGKWLYSYAPVTVNYNNGTVKSFPAGFIVPYPGDVSSTYWNIQVANGKMVVTPVFANERLKWYSGSLDINVTFTLRQYGTSYKVLEIRDVNNNIIGRRWLDVNSQAFMPLPYGANVFLYLVDVDKGQSKLYGSFTVSSASYVFTIMPPPPPSVYPGNLTAVFESNSSTLHVWGSCRSPPCTLVVKKWNTTGLYSVYTLSITTPGFDARIVMSDPYTIVELTNADGVLEARAFTGSTAVINSTVANELYTLITTIAEHTMPNGDARWLVVLVSALTFLVLSTVGDVLIGVVAMSMVMVFMGWAVGWAPIWGGGITILIFTAVLYHITRRW